jgi:two-component system alkaline phosphatase synthesis response regulator PhoP
LDGPSQPQAPTVLVVDDDASIRELLRRILESAGYHVVTAHDAPSALEAMAAHGPQVAFLDVHMPGANGLWLADQIREQFPTAATVLATADRDLSPIENVRRGIIGYLVKPFLRDDVIRAVQDGVNWARALRDIQH